jgi:hypothetical protein
LTRRRRALVRPFAAVVEDDREPHDSRSRFDGLIRDESSDRDSRVRDYELFALADSA